jgi:AcrR family transcriptional regulator
MIQQRDNNEALTRREREKAQHRKEIIDAAISVFAEKGFHAATLDEVAQKAEFSKGALYLYFQNKEDLLFTVLKESMGGWAISLSEMFSGKRPFREELQDTFINTAEKIFEMPDLYTLLSAQHAALFRALSEDNRRELYSLNLKFTESVEKRVIKAIRDRELRDMKPEAIIGMINGSLSSMIFNHWNCKTLESLKKAIVSYIDVVFNGIAYRKE